MSSKAPFFIVGSGRSGSTLLRLILSSHSNIYIPPETWFMIPLFEQVPLTEILTESEADKAIKIITSHYRWPDMKIEKEKFFSMVTELDRLHVKDILDLIYNYHLKLNNKIRWGDKTPPYIKIVHKIASVYPEAKFIHIIRDGRDVCKSFQNKGWNGKWLCKNLVEWKESIKLYDSYKKTNLAKKIYEVRYEDLVLRTEHTIKKICSFLGEEFEPQMLDWRDVALREIPDREKHIHEKILRKPRESDVQKWRRELSVREIFIIESYLYNELKSLGYDLRFNQIYWPPFFFITRLFCESIFFCNNIIIKVICYFSSSFKRIIMQNVKKAS